MAKLKLFKYSIKFSLIRKSFTSFIRSSDEGNAVGFLRKKFATEFIEGSVEQVPELSIEDWAEQYCPDLRFHIQSYFGICGMKGSNDDIALEVVKIIKAHLDLKTAPYSINLFSSLDIWCNEYWPDAMEDISLSINDKDYGYCESLYDLAWNIVGMVKNRFECKVLDEIEWID